MKGTGYLLQATLISLWWIGLLVNQNFYNAFQFPGIGDAAFLSFFLPDLIVVAILSIVRAYRPLRALEFVILGGFGFATLYCINASLLTYGGFLSTTAMILGLCYNFFLTFRKNAFRISSTNGFLINAIKTIVQIVCVWLITLLVFPLLILDSFGVVSINSVDFRIIASVIFVAFSALGLYSAFIMVKHGKGTPLPIDQTQNLVIDGPYKYVRNPMAIAGLGQGVSVSLFCGSVHVLIYTIIGAALWHFVVKPLEEENMLERFGSDYIGYKNRVKCWVPKFN